MNKCNRLPLLRSSLQRNINNKGQPSRSPLRDASEEIEGGTLARPTARHLSLHGMQHTALAADCIKGMSCTMPTKKTPSPDIVLHLCRSLHRLSVLCLELSLHPSHTFNPVTGHCRQVRHVPWDAYQPNGTRAQLASNACLKTPIEIEIVDQLEWSQRSTLPPTLPAMPNAGHTISTTRITLPENTATLERVDIELPAP